jgi:hypothetical protein
LVHIRPPLLRDEPYAEKDFGSNKEQPMPTDHTELTLEQLDTVTGGENAAVAGAMVGASMMGVTPHGDPRPTLPCDSFDIICRIFS